MKPPDIDRHGDRSPDWDAARRRLAAAVKWSEDWERLSPERAQQVLDERARALARVPPAEPDSKEILEVMTFRLASERYAVEARFVREVLRSFECTPVPGGPDFLVGVTNLRGQVLAVVDLSRFFDLPSVADQRPWVLVLGTDRAEFGVLAHAVDEVTTLRVDQIRQMPGSVPTIAREFLRGVTPDALLVLNGPALLAADRLVVDQSE